MAIAHCFWHLVVRLPMAHFYMRFRWKRHGNFQIATDLSGHEWPLQIATDILLKNNAYFWGFLTSQWSWMALFKGDRWENVDFLRKPSHVTPQIDHLGKMSPVLRVSTHIYGVPKEIHGETFIFWVNWGIWPLQIDGLGKTSPFLRAPTPIYGFSKEIDGKTLIFRVNLCMWPLKSIVLEKWALFWGF